MCCLHFPPQTPTTMCFHSGFAVYWFSESLENTTQYSFCGRSPTVVHEFFVISVHIRFVCNFLIQLLQTKYLHFLWFCLKKEFCGNLNIFDVQSCLKWFIRIEKYQKIGIYPEWPCCCVSFLEVFVKRKR